ncbi:MAG TPA: hypothetical protein VLA11_04575 [Woeseiaceae bacterium]|jgi:hypothetical protein|nr:hypothetical protein [Woeseiaceae bacterium]
MRTRSVIVALFAVTVIVLTLPVRANGDIIVAARETQAIVVPRNPRLRLVNLPALEFALRAAIKCRGEPVSVTFSISDTFRTLTGDDLDNTRAAETILRVPARQMTLAASSRFCVADDPESANELLVSGFATAHASLRCRKGDSTSAHFASAPLRVRLTCARQPEENAQEVPEPAGSR